MSAVGPHELVVVPARRVHQRAYVRVDRVHESVVAGFFVPRTEPERFADFHDYQTHQTANEFGLGHHTKIGDERPRTKPT